MVPVWGSGKSFVYDLYMGNYGEAIIDGAVTAMDVVGVVTGVQGLAKFGAGLMAEMTGELAAEEAAAAALRSSDSAVVAANLARMSETEAPVVLSTMNDVRPLGDIFLSPVFGSPYEMDFKDMLAELEENGWTVNKVTPDVWKQWYPGTIGGAGFDPFTTTFSYTGNIKVLSALEESAHWELQMKNDAWTNFIVGNQLNLPAMEIQAKEAVLAVHGAQMSEAAKRMYEMELAGEYGK
jgi:hypothetical protein